MTARTEVVAALTAVLPSDITILPYSRSIDPPYQSTVMVRVDEVRPSVQPQAFREYKFAVLVIAKHATFGAADDELDSLLEDVLLAIDKSTLLTWQLATRASFEEKYPAYEVEIAVTVKKES